MNFPLSTAFTVSHRFLVVMFSFSFVSMHILISLFISSVIFWLFRSVLFSLHTFVFLIVFFFCSWHLILPRYDQKRYLKWFPFFLTYQGQIYGPGCVLSWRMFHVHLRKRWNSFFWGEMSYRTIRSNWSIVSFEVCVSLLISVWLIYP